MQDTRKARRVKRERHWQSRLLEPLHLCEEDQSVHQPTAREIGWIVEQTAIQHSSPLSFLPGNSDCEQGFFHHFGLAINYSNSALFVLVCFDRLGNRGIPIAKPRAQNYIPPF
jgi:hypothetical protein